MNSQNAKDYLPLVHALVEGKIIQQFVMSAQTMEMEWRDDLTPTWCTEARFYRIKPEPPVLRHWWILFSNEKAFVYTDKDSATRYNTVWADSEVVEVVEVKK